MASNYMSPEISSINIDGGDPDFFKGVEVVFDDALLMTSLLEESQAGDHHHHDENDDERLRSVIQSLEAEIGPNTLMSSDHGSCGVGVMNPAAAEMALKPSAVHDHDDLLNVQGDQMDHLGIDFELVDMEMMVPSSPSDHHDMDYNYWYMEPSETNDVIEFGVTDYSQICYEIPLEEHGYSSLWQV